VDGDKSPTAGATGQLLFCELFAGTGKLTQAVQAAGIECRRPDEYSVSGVNFDSVKEVRELKDELRRHHEAGRKLVLHLAPPCATFSRARDRRANTRLRTPMQPLGTKPRSPMVEQANRIARRALDLASWSHRELGAVVSLENPSASYLWLAAQQRQGSPDDWHDIRLSQCMFDARWRKDTRLRCWGSVPHTLSRLCTRTADGHSCGLKVGEHHAILEFGQEVEDGVLKTYPV
jgi:hypothetical protein